ncbi:helix-turn-helix domain-containing protein [Streptomyces galilaeus]|uniref:helix-turn-helix domain-containing protein n=1 Tax=Streptomyces galilaeus TaxID=33899 RepID=UPI003570EC2F
MAQGWANERWTLSRVRLLIVISWGALSIRGVWELLRRHGWWCQQPARRSSGTRRGQPAGGSRPGPRAKPPLRRSSRTRPLVGVRSQEMLDRLSSGHG